MRHGTDEPDLGAIARSIAAAGKALQLYPATSPIPRQAIDSAVESIEGYLATRPVMALTVSREGLAWDGSPSAASAPGLSDLADRLRDHGVAEVAFLPGCASEDLLTLLTAVARPADEARASGGIAAVLVAEGVDNIRVTEVLLTVLDTGAEERDVDVDEFLSDLVADPERLSTWLAASSSADSSAFGESLAELALVASSDLSAFVRSLAAAFRLQEAPARDALLGLALEPGDVRDLIGQMFTLLKDREIATAITSGKLGSNMLALSSALTRLPLGDQADAVHAEVHALLPQAGHTAKEAAFLDHMIEVRRREDPEAALVDRDATYRSVAEAADLAGDIVAQACSAVTESSPALNAAAVRTILTLLDQQRDYELYRQTAAALSASVPRLAEQGDLPLAARIVSELSAREARSAQPWPDVSEYLRATIGSAMNERTMKAVIKAVSADDSLVPFARELLTHAGESGSRALTTEAIAQGADGLRVAQELLGRRLIDVLNAVALATPWYHMRPVAEYLARVGDSRSLATLTTILQRGNEQARREAIEGLAAIDRPDVARLLNDALQDPRPDVAIVAARALGTCGAPGATRALTDRLRELDIDGKDFLLAREIIAALARVPDEEAGATLDRLSRRRQLIKRPHYAEVQDLVRQAMDYRSRGGV